MHIFKIEKIKKNSIYLYKDDIHHILNVLHKKIGENILCSDGSKIYLTKIKSKSPFILEILSEKENILKEYNINFYIGVIDKKSFEDAAIFLNQANCKSITPVFFSRSQGNIFYDFDRLKKIIEESNKQCQRVNGININSPISFHEMTNLINNKNWFVAYENEKNNIELDCGYLDEINIIIGPEGGITIDEINSISSLGAKSIKLTSTILKTQVAAIFLAGMMISKFFMKG